MDYRELRISTEFRATPSTVTLRTKKGRSARELTERPLFFSMYQSIFGLSVSRARGLEVGLSLLVSQLNVRLDGVLIQVRP